MARSSSRMVMRARVGASIIARCFASRRGGPKNWVGKVADKEEISPTKLHEISDELKKESKKLGLSIVGITSPRRSSRFDKYEEWLAQSYNGEMDYMEREDRVARRRDPTLILPRVQSVIMVGLFYWPGRSGFPPQHSPWNSKFRDEAGNETKEAATRSEKRGIMSSYAWGADYHKILEPRLKQLGQKLNTAAGGVGRFYVDTGAVLERDFAERAGLGFIGKNSLLINPVRGSGFFIGELFSTVRLPRDGDDDLGTKVRGPGEPGCGKCRKCIVACPTGAIVRDYVVDARKCISYLTIELKGGIPEELRALMGNRVYGCDVCQQVCPWNRVDWERPDDAVRKEGGGFSALFGYVDEDVTSPRLVELLQLDEEGFRKRFAGTAVKRIGRERLARNAAVALGNVGGRAELDVLRQAALRDSSAIVREHAEWAVRRIESKLQGASG